MKAVAQLLADSGKAAAGEEFFRSREFLAAEGVTHTLRIEAEDGALLIPLVVRPIDDDGELDATSPYGYPGAAGSLPSPLDPMAIDFSATGLVSTFVRHALGAPPLAGSRRAQRRPDRRPRAAAQEPVERSQPDQQEPPRGLRGRAGARPAERRRRPSRLPGRLRGDDAPRRRRGALLLRRRLLRSHSRLRAILARPGPGPGRGRRRRFDRRPERRLPPLLPQRHARTATCASRR